MESSEGVEETKQEMPVVSDPLNLEVIDGDVDKVSRILMKKEEEEKLLYFMTRRLGMTTDNPNYDYEETQTLLRKFLTGFCSPLELISEDEIFDLFLLKFKKNIMKENIAIQIVEDTPKETSDNSDNSDN